MSGPQEIIEKCVLIKEHHEADLKMEKELLEEIINNNDFNDIVYYIYCLGFANGFLTGNDTKQ